MKSSWTADPVGRRIVVEKEPSRNVTRGGIILPASSEVPTLTGIVKRVGRLKGGEKMFPVKVGDKVLFDPRRAIPVDLDDGNSEFIVNCSEVLAVFRRTETAKTG